jgi:hypothetical protein
MGRQIKMGLKEIRQTGIYLAQDRGQWRPLVSTAGQTRYEKIIDQFRN